MSDPAHEERARATKAFKLTRLFLTVSIPVDDVRALSVEGWAHAAKLAKVRPPSEQTKALVIQWLDDSEER